MVIVSKGYFNFLNNVFVSEWLVELIIYEILFILELKVMRFDLYDLYETSIIII